MSGNDGKLSELGYGLEKTLKTFQREKGRKTTVDGKTCVVINMVLRVATNNPPIRMKSDQKYVTRCAMYRICV
jgi:hypothetical protein